MQSAQRKYWDLTRSTVSKSLPRGAQENTGETRPQQNSWLSGSPAVQRFGLPQPPPPGLSIRTLSPERSLTLDLPGIVSSEPSRRMIKVRPGAPSVPPASPYGPRERRSAGRVTWASVKTSVLRVIPSPPVWRPPPPLLAGRGTCRRRIREAHSRAPARRVGGAHEGGGGGEGFGGEAGENGEGGRVGDGLDCVDRTLDLRVAAGEVDGDLGGGLLTRRGGRRGKPRLYGGFFGG